MSCKFALGILCATTIFSTQSSAGCRSYQLDNSLQLEQLWQDIGYLASDQLKGRKSQSAGASLARQYISQRFTQAQLEPLNADNQYSVPFVYKLIFGQVEGINVAGVSRGSLYPEKYIVVTAHYDHLGQKGRKIYNGADDNASGVATLLALADHVARFPLKYSVLFLATDAEEKGLYGAKAFVDSQLISTSNMIINLNLDMLAQGGRTNRLYVSSSESSIVFTDIISQAQQQAGLCLVSGHRSSRRGYASSQKINWRKASDHAAFYEVGVPYFFVGVADHRYYHTSDDIVENIEADFFSAAAQTSLKLLLLIEQNAARLVAQKKAES